MKKKLILIFLLFHWLSILFAQRLEIHQINVGVGSATLVVTYSPPDPNGLVIRTSAILIDAGLPGPGSLAIRNYLNENHITQLTAVYATHYDNDHIGGFVGTSTNTGILNSSFVDQYTYVYDRGTPNSASATTTSYINRANTFTRHTTLTSGTTHSLYRSGTTTNNINLNIVAVNGIINGVNYNVNNENDLSSVMVLSFNGFNFFLGGDLSGRCTTTGDGCGSSAPNFANTDYGAAVANELVQYPLNRGGALMTHHGAENTYTGFINSNNLSPPLFALISSGKQANYQHPRQSSLNLLYAASIVTYITAANLYNRATRLGGEFDPVRGSFVNGNIVVGVDASGTITINGESVSPPNPQ